MSYDTAEPVEARVIQDHLRAILAAPGGPLRDAVASLDASERQRLWRVLRAAEPAGKTCLAPRKGWPHCGNPALVRCMEGWLGRGKCEDAPA